MPVVRTIGVAAQRSEASQQGACCRRTGAALEWLRRFLREYLLEWRLTDRASADALEARVAAIEMAINGSDVVCFVKPGGVCPFCNLATRILDEAATELGFTLHIADLLAEDRESLKVAMQLPMLTWPVIFLRGVHLAGGGEAIARMHKQEGELAKAVHAERSRFEAPRPLPLETHPRPLLLHQAGGGSWLGCQSRIYGNVLRGIAVLQIALLVPANELQKRGMLAGSIPLQCILAVDALLFCLCGPTPFSPLGCLATLAVWRRRGTVAPLVPYKVTMGGLYFLMNAISVGCQLNAQVSARGGTAGGSTEDGFLCKLVRSDGLVNMMLSNSALLAVLRF